MLEHNLCFSASRAQLTWQGKRVIDTHKFTAYLQGPVRSRLLDEAHQQRFQADLRALATTNMAVDTLAKLLAPDADVEPWEVGEALAECLLEHEHNVRWPWNVERDKRTPRASLPGADLVGFAEANGDVYLALGEVKTSNDHETPPGVMTGRSGLIHQLDQLASNPRLHRTLLAWLDARCKNTEFWETYQQAATNYLASGGKAVMLFGLLMRDTDPHELDIKNRAEKLATIIQGPTRVELMAWYFPHSISDWPLLTLKAMV